jgi:hypothetical protein
VAESSSTVLVQTKSKGTTNSGTYQAATTVLVTRYAVTSPTPQTKKTRVIAVRSLSASRRAHHDRSSWSRDTARPTRNSRPNTYAVATSVSQRGSTGQADSSGARFRAKTTSV